MPALKRTDTARPEPQAAALRSTEEMEREAYEQGYAVGERAGFEMGEQKAKLLLDRLEKVVCEVAVLKEGLIKELEGQVLELASAIAGRIVKEELALRPEVIVRIVQEAMKKVERTGKIRIRLNPSLHDLFLRMKPELLEIHPDIAFDVDPAAPANGPVVIGEREVVLTDIDTQVQHVIEDLEAGHGET